MAQTTRRWLSRRDRAHRSGAPGRRSSTGGILTLFLPGLLLLGAAAAPAASQQLVTEDAAVVERGACQLESWYGERAVRIEPACQLIPNLEITVGVGWEGARGDRDLRFLLQGKHLFSQLEPGGFGVGLVAGVEMYGPADGGGNGLAEAFVVVPVGRSSANNELVLHLNVGWLYHRDDDHADHAHAGHTHDDHDPSHPIGHHAITWASRLDVGVPRSGERLTLIGELFGEGLARPEYQVGLRSVIIPARLSMDLTWGGNTSSDTHGEGWVLGAAWTPPPIF